VSLTSQLTAGELGAWFTRRLDDTRGREVVLDAVDAAIRGRRPIRPPAEATGGHWATIGGALGQRLAFLVEPAPPYFALLGAHTAGLAGPATLDATAIRYPTPAALDPARRARALDWRPTVGGWTDLADPGAAPVSRFDLPTPAPRRTPCPWPWPWPWPPGMAAPRTSWPRSVTAWPRW